MDSTELNKIMAAFLTAGIAFGLAGVIGGKLVHSERPEKPAFKIVSALPAGVAVGPRKVPIAALLAHADPTAGQSDAQRLCGSCHTFTPGAPAGVGPNLYDVVGAPIAATGGFDYSASLKAHKGNWTFDALNDWLEDPKAFASGTKMAFAGINNDKQRADVIDYLRTLSPHPLPLPPVPKEAPAPAQAAATAPAGPSFVQMVAEADPHAGGDAAQRYCGACHSFAQGGPNEVGPDLYGIVNKPIAAGGGYDFSAALKAKHAAWTYDNLNAWLTDPKAWAPGTKMAFAGIPSEKQRAAVVAYLRTLATTPAPLPGTAGPGSADRAGTPTPAAQKPAGK